MRDGEPVSEDWFTVEPQSSSD